MEYFKKNKIIGLALNCLFFICVGKMEANPSCSQIKVDGNKQIVSVWQELDSEANVSKIMGTYGIDSVAVCLSNCKATTSYQPVIAISRLKSNNAPAVAVWKALDLSTQDQILQVATATKKGWIAHSPFTLSDPKAEVPQSEYNVDISDDGKVIGVTWNTYLIYEKKNAIRRVYSLDGGVTWSSPATLGP